jgi:hypothetical protein
MPQDQDTEGLPLFTPGYDLSLDDPIFSDLSEKVVAKFKAFHAANPHIYDLFLRFTNQLVKRGRTRYGMKSIAERVRWEMAVETAGDDFKINNIYMSCYARLLILKNPDLKDFFETRHTPGTSRENKNKEE